MKTYKFTFHLKNGKTFECIEKLSNELLAHNLNVIRFSMEDDKGSLKFDGCIVRLSEVAVVEWECLDES